MRDASILIKPASSNCNMDCEYCFYKCLSSNRAEYSKGFMKEKTLELLVRQAIDYADHSLTFAFQGGEPTLCGIDFYRKALLFQKKYNKKNLRIFNTLQTNGLLIDENWGKFLSENNFLVGLSMDGPRKIHDWYRKDHTGRGTFYNLMETMEIFDRYQVEYNILCVVTAEASKRAYSLYKFFRKHHVSFLQFIPCMDEKNRLRKNESRESMGVSTSIAPYESVKSITVDINSPFTPQPEQYGYFLCELFDLWYDDFCRGEDVEIRMFSNLAQMAAGFPSEECGMSGKCNCYFVVEGNGDVYPCDFYCEDAWKLGTIQESFENMYHSEKARLFEESSWHLHEKCQNCSYLPLCRGGCRRWREASGDNEIPLHYLCSAYQIFFAHTEERIRNLGDLIRQRI
ncbi:MAG: anaerobic sulfatase maturase [Clostridiales bacterium]|nr:anaerobic sulfatase maturase [Clostridiales bacterium]